VGAKYKERELVSRTQEDLAMYRSKVVLAGAVLFAAAAMADVPQGKYKGWGLDQERAHVKRREDPSTWDKRLFDIDRKEAKENPGRPFVVGAFPVPRYDLAGKGSFGGLGVMGNMEYPWHDHYVAGDCFFAVRGPVNEKFIGDRQDQAFFHILVLSEKKDAFGGSLILSRNHPHAMGQGIIKTAKAEIDYVAFQTADRNAYAIVNMRLFDLRAGRVILIAPQKDGTLRSLQVEAPALESKQVKDFDAKLLKEPRIIEFLDMPGNI
jgi:hypothetical protein